MATTKVTMPQLGESAHEGTISKWLAKPGDKLVEFEPMLEVDTDKVNAEVPAPVSGVLKEILAQEGQTVQAGTEIALVELEGEGDRGAAPDQVVAPAAAAGQASGAGDAMPSAEQAEAADAESKPSPQAPAQPAAQAPSAQPDGQGHRFSPGVVMLAEESGVDLAQVKGTGLGGRVTKRDVRQLLEAQRRGEETSPATPAAGASGPSGGAVASQQAAGEGDQRVPLSRMRRLIAENMTTSKATIPHAWQTQEVDMSGVVANRARNKAAFAEREDFSLTYLPYVVAAAVASLREHPEVNASFNGDEIILHRTINLGISVGFEDALLVPVIKNADSLSLAGIARAVNDLATRAKAKQLKGDDLQGGTFTVNNSGTFGTLFSYSVISPGQAGILTMEAIVERPVAVKGMIGIKPMMYLCFSFDHRTLDGLQAARYLTSCRFWLEAVTPETPIY